MSRSSAAQIPIHSRAFLEPFVVQYGNHLFRRSVSLCRSLGIEDFAEDALQHTVVRLLTRGRPIQNTGPHSALRYAKRVLRCLCVDEWQRRVRQPLGQMQLGTLGDGGELEQLARDLSPDLSALVDARTATRASLLCFEYLPVYVAERYPSAGRNLKAFWLACVEGFNDHEVAQALGITKADRTMRARGRRHLLGWLSALYFAAGPPAGNRTYQVAWQTGYDAGVAFQQDWPDWWPLIDYQRSANDAG